MQEKALRSTTIIPPSLYIERNADRQLDRIIADMGRPGYVLVARQMGKTNLLINMKRQRERSGDLVVYRDLSNRTSSSRALFRQIVDSIMEEQSSLFETIRPVINAQRKEQDLEPNVEYDRHLRMVLSACDNKRVIIILDEIDSLVSSPYSDAVFAQIRSMYFSRINHSEYDRLTYVLSGVAEPTDLIKDKNISPFNIGEKIYLDDFTKKEVSLFVKRAGLDFPAEVIDEIFSWTAGNPRMTWDTCSAIEDDALSGTSLTPASVRAAIKKLYLTRFDVAPVDHIRVLVESDPMIRSAVASIRWNKGETLDEKTRSRLYLAGITGMATGAPPTIKNKVIDAALSDAWLAQVSAGQRSFLEAASDSYFAGNFDQVVRLVDEFSRGQSAGYSLPLESQFQLGVALFRLGEHQRSSNELELAHSKSEDTELNPAVEFFLASAYLKAGKPAEALPLFEKAAQSPGMYNMRAKLALGSTLLVIGARDHAAHILSLNADIIQSSSIDDKHKSPGTEEGVLVVSAYFNSSQAYIASGDRGNALSCLDSAMALCSTSEYPRIALQRINLTPDVDDRRETISGIVDYILQNGVIFGDQSSPLNFNESVLAFILSKAAELSDFKSFDALLHYAAEAFFHQVHSKFDLVVKIIKSAIASEDKIPVSPLVWTAYEHYLDHESDARRRLELVQQLAQNTAVSRRDEAMEIYLSSFEERQSTVGLKEEDVVIFLDYIYERINKNDSRGALYLINYIKSHIPDDLSPLYRLVFTNQEMVVYQNLGDIPSAQKAARELKSDLYAELELSSEFVATVNYVKQRADEVLLLRAPDPYSKIGRNQIVTIRETDGQNSFSVKFKKIEADLRSGRYALIDVKPNGNTKPN